MSGRHREIGDSASKQHPERHNQTTLGSGDSQSPGGFVVGIPDELPNETNSDSGNSGRSRRRSFFQKLSLSLSDIRVILDPMLLYVFINGWLYGIRGISFDRFFGLTICILNIFLDFTTEFPFRRLLQGLPNIRRLLHPNDLWKNRTECLITLYNLFLHIPSSLVLMILFHIPLAINENLLMFAIVLICLRSLKSIFQMQKWYRKSRTSANSYAWFFMFLVFYAAFSHLLGGFWYIQAVFKQVDCWREAYNKYGDQYIGNLDQYSDKLNEYCSQNTTSGSYDFGIYRDAFRSGILLEMAPFPRRIINCFRWALQNLSSFGQGLQPSADVWENIFVIVIILASVFLFSFTIGKVQIFLQYTIKKNDMIKKKLQEIEQWLPFQKLTKDLQSEVKNYYKNVWYATKGDNKKHLLYDLPKDLRQKLIPELCIDLLKKVEEFRSWSEQPSKLNEASLADLCECVKLVSYEEDTNVIRKGDPIDKVIFVLQGKLWLYTPSDAIASATSSCNPSNPGNDLLKDSSFWGQEVISQLQAKPHRSDLPVSNRSIQAVTNVEAFVLRAYDLKNIFVKRLDAQLASQQAANTGNPAQSQP